MLSRKKETNNNNKTMQFPPSVVLALAAVVTTGTINWSNAFVPLSSVSTTGTLPSPTLSSSSSSVKPQFANKINKYNRRRPVSILSSSTTATEEDKSAASDDAETYEYVCSRPDFVSVIQCLFLFLRLLSRTSFWPVKIDLT